MTNPIIPWIGGKRRLAKHILPMFPEHQCYAEPFCGAAALFFMKGPSKTEVINDINGELINLYRVVQNHLEEFYRQFKHALVSRQIYEWLKITPTEILTDIQRAARFYYLQKMSFGGKIESQSFGVAPSAKPRLNLLRLEQDLSDAHLRLSRAYIENLSWDKLIEKYDREYSLFYCDPPYWQTEGYGVKFGFEQYERLAKLARTIKGKMIISHNDHPDIRALFDGMKITEANIKYTVGGVEKSPITTELIIQNW